MPEPMTIFLAEDNPADVYLLRIAFEEISFGERQREPVDLIVASDGEQALDFFEHRDPFRNAARPDLIVLDLNLPKSDGTDILRSVRQSREYADVPIVVLTSSDSPRDRESARELGADCYLTKPTDLESFLGLGERLVSIASQRSRIATH